MTLQSAISFSLRVLAVWLASHAVPPVHAQDAVRSPLPPTAAGHGAHFRLQPQAVDAERAPSYRPERQLDTTVRRRPSALLISGIVTFAVSYLATALIAEMQLTLDSDVDPGQKCGENCSRDNLLFIPLVGPWLRFAQDRDGSALSAILGASQLLGLALTAGGAFVYAHSGRSWLASAGRDRFTFAALPTRGGAQLALWLAL